MNREHIELNCSMKDFYQRTIQESFYLSLSNLIFRRVIDLNLLKKLNNFSLSFLQSAQWWDTFASPCGYCLPWFLAVQFSWSRICSTETKNKPLWQIPSRLFKLLFHGILETNSRKVILFRMRMILLTLMSPRQPRPAGIISQRHRRPLRILPIADEVCWSTEPTAREQHLSAECSAKILRYSWSTNLSGWPSDGERPSRTKTGQTASSSWWMESLVAIFRIFAGQHNFLAILREIGQPLLSRTRSRLQTFATFQTQVYSRVQTSYKYQNSPRNAAPQCTNIASLRWLKFACLTRCCQISSRKST